jgi:hypothetical protein
MYIFLNIFLFFCVLSYHKLLKKHKCVQFLYVFIYTGVIFCTKFFYFFLYIYINIYTTAQGMNEARQAGRQARQASGRGRVDEAGNRGGRAGRGGGIC